MTNPIGDHLAKSLRNVWAPVSHANVNRHPKLQPKQFALLQRDLRQRRAADNRITMFNFFDDVRWERPSSRNSPQKVRYLFHRIRAAVREQQDSGVAVVLTHLWVAASAE